MEFFENLTSIKFEEVLSLYKSVGWTAYVENPESLKQAIANSTFTVSAIKNGKLLGFCRSISDDVSIHYLQDILVHPKYQRKGIGKTLSKCVWSDFLMFGLM